MSEVLQQTLAGKRTTTDKSEVEAGCGKEDVSGKSVENDGKRTYLCGMWEHFSCERSKVKKFRRLADEEKQAGIQGQWQQESPAREYLEEVKCCHDTDWNESSVKKGFTACKNGTWEKMKSSDRAFDRIKEAFELVALDETEKMSIAPKNMLRSTDYLRRIIAPVGGQGGVTMSYLCPKCNSFPLEDYVCGEKYDWKQPNRLLVVQTG